MNRGAWNSRGDLGRSYAQYGGGGVSPRGDAYARYEGGYRDTYARNGSEAYARYNGDEYPRNGYSGVRNDFDINPIGGLLNLVFAGPGNVHNDRISYCAARYQSFDRSSGTYLAHDGFRYYC
jgi:hypothetical protein